MLNSTKTWQEWFRLKLYNVYATVFQLSKYDNQQLKEKADVMVQFISDLRKKDEEELIKMLPDYRMVFPEQDTEDIIKYKLGFNDGIQKIKQLIEDYYEN